MKDEKERARRKGEKLLYFVAGAGLALTITCFAKTDFHGALICALTAMAAGGTLWAQTGKEVDKHG